MSNKLNSEITEKFINVLVERIARRTSESFAVATLHGVIEKLLPKYDFLKNIEIKRTIYSEGIDAVSVSPSINQVRFEELKKSLNEILILTVKHLEHEADYFFIKEFRDSIEKISPDLIEDIDINLNLLQTKYLVNRQEEQKINNKEITENVLSALATLTNSALPEKQAIEKLSDTVEKLTEKYDFLQLIKIPKTPDKEGFYNIEINDQIRNIWLNDLGNAFQDLIQEIVNNIDWKSEDSFIDAFKKQFTDKELIELQKTNLDLNHINLMVERKEHKQIIKKSIDALIKIIGEKTSISFATHALDEIIKKLKQTHKVLNYVNIDKTKYDKGFDAVTVSDEINSVDPYVLGKAIRDIIKQTGHNLGDKTFNYIENFKAELGEEYIDEIGKIGVNLQFLELKFA